MATINANRNWTQEPEHITETVEFSDDFNDNNLPPILIIEEINLVPEINDQQSNFNFQGENNDQIKVSEQADVFEHFPPNEINQYLSIQNINEHEVTTLKQLSFQTTLTRIIHH